MRTVPGRSDRDNPFLWTPGIAARETLRYLDSKGVDAEQVLSRAGISRDQLSQRGSGVTVASQYQFLELAAAQAQDSLLGLHVATEMDVRNAGVPYYLAASSATILEALEHSARYSRTVSEAVIFELTPRNDETVLTARPARPFEPRRQYCEFMALLVIRVLRMLPIATFLHRAPPSPIWKARIRKKLNVSWDAPSSLRIQWRVGSFLKRSWSSRSSRRIASCWKS